MATNRSAFEQLLDRYSEETRRAFLDAYDGIKSRVVLKRLVALLQAGDVNGAVNLLGIDAAAFSGVDLAISNAFNNGGIAFAKDLGRASIAFGVRNLESEAILRQYSAEQITRETENTKAMIRQRLSEGLARGDNPTRTALDLVGQQNKATGTRTGGYIGLSAPQEATSGKARSALLSGDTEGMRAYLQLKHRDKRFDGQVRKALEAGKGLSQEATAKLIGRMNDRQLKYRGDVIGLHETRNALAMARHEAMRQAIEAGKVDARFVTKTWKHSGNEHPRLQHLAMNNETVKWGESFIMADGTAIDYPHAPGIPARHSIGCDCRVEIKVDYTAMLVESTRAA